MYVLFTGGRTYSGGGWVGVKGAGGSGGSGPSDKRGEVHPVHEKKFSAPVWSKNKWGEGGLEVPGPLPWVRHWGML